MGRVGRWSRRAFLPLSLTILIAGGLLVPLPAFIERPGSAIGLGRCVQVQDYDGSGLNGDFLLTTISDQRATAFALALAAVHPEMTVLSTEAVLGSETSEEYQTRQRQLFASSTDRAVAVALVAAGLPVTVHGDGVLVVEVLEGSPAEPWIQTGDVIVAVNGERVETDTDLASFVDAEKLLQLRVNRDGQEHRVRLRPMLGLVDGEERPIIGVRIQTLNPRTELPLPVEVPSGTIGGPSAGLMVGLVVYDIVDQRVELAAGRRVAGTGTLSSDGRVGPIGRIRLKVRAALRAGADVFLAPASQVDQARSAVPPGRALEVIGVSTFEEAIARLKATAGGVETTVEPAPCRLRPAA